MTADGAAKPALTSDALTRLVKAQESRSEPRRDTFAALATAYLGSPEYLGLAERTRSDYREWIDRARRKFGKANMRALGNPKMRGELLDWRDTFAASPRQADYGMMILARVIGWGVQRGWLAVNPAAGAPTLYRSDRSEIVWENHEVEAVCSEMLPHQARAFRLAAWTGLARGDLVKLRWDEVRADYIERRRSKSGVAQIIPLFDETRALLAECKAFQSKRKNKVAAVTVVTNRTGTPFTSRGFGVACERAKKEAGVRAELRLHDLRGTFATRLMQRGFEDAEVDAILGWTGKSARIRRAYISRGARVISAIERMRRRESR
jgi:integrase